METDPGQISGIPDDVGGATSDQSSSTIDSEFTSNTCTPTQDFPFSWNGVLINFWSGQSVPVGAALLAALQAQGAPITTP